MPSKETSSYIMPGIFLGIILIMFILGTWMLYERVRGGHQAALNEAVAQLPPFSPEAAAKEEAKAIGVAWPVEGPKTTLEAVAKRIDRLMADPPEAGAAKPERKDLECKYYGEAGYVKDSSGVWISKESMVKRLVEAKREKFDAERAQKVEQLRKENSSGGFFPLELPPKEEGK